MVNKFVLVRRDETENFEQIQSTDTALVGQGVRANLGNDLTLSGNLIWAEQNLLPISDQIYDLGGDSYYWKNVYSQFLFGGQCASGIAGALISVGDAVAVKDSSGPKIFLADGSLLDSDRYVIGVAVTGGDIGNTIIYQYSGIVTVEPNQFDPAIAINSYGQVWLSDVSSGKFMNIPSISSGFINQKIGNIIHNPGDTTIKILLQLGYSYEQP